MTDSLNKLETKIIGKKIQRFSELDSTNEEAKRRICLGAEEGQVFMADSQTEGRGRWGRFWISKLGGMYISVVLKPYVNLGNQGQLTLISAVAVVRGIKILTGLSATIRWPNDILISGKKVGGILCELQSAPDSTSWVIAGIGLNVNNGLDSFPSDLKDKVTSLLNECGAELEVKKLTGIILEQLDRLYIEYLKQGFMSLKPELEILSSTLGQWVKVITEKAEIPGKVCGLGDRGELILKTGDGTILKVTSGEVVYVNY